MESLEARVNKLEERIKDLLAYSLQNFIETGKLIQYVSHPMLYSNYMKIIDEGENSPSGLNYRDMANDELIRMNKKRGASGSDPNAVSGGKRRKNKTRKSRR
jgi:hypothetical protein